MWRFTAGASAGWRSTTRASGSGVRTWPPEPTRRLATAPPQSDVSTLRGEAQASDLRRALAEAGLVLWAGKMSHLWSGQPISVRLDDLDVICAVLECTPSELLLPDPPARRAPASGEQPGPAAPA